MILNLLNHIVKSSFWNDFCSCFGFAKCFFSGFPVGSATRTRGKTISNVVAELGRFFVVVWFQRDAQIQGLLDCKWHSAAESAQNGLGPGFRYMTHIKAGHGKCTGLSDFSLFRRVSRCVFSESHGKWPRNGATFHWDKVFCLQLFWFLCPR